MRVAAVQVASTIDSTANRDLVEARLAALPAGLDLGDDPLQLVARRGVGDDRGEGAQGLAGDLAGRRRGGCVGHVLTLTESWPEVAGWRA